jgi:cytochrome c oxidase subunit II
MKSALRFLAIASVVLATVAAVASAPARADEPRVVAVTAKRFEFEPKEIHVKKGESVVLEITSQDVTHGFFSRKFGFDEDLAPGKTVRIPIRADEAGPYLVICDHFCGSGHGGMKMTIVVE